MNRFGTASHWTQQEDKDDIWRGLRLFVVDGALFRTPDTPELAEHFEYINLQKSALSFGSVTASLLLASDHFDSLHKTLLKHRSMPMSY